MRIEDLENRINLVDLIEKDYKLLKVGNSYRLNPCPICGHKDHFTVYPETNSYSSFNNCCIGGSVYKYLQEVKGMSEDEARSEMLILANINNKKAGNLSTTIESQPSQQKDYTTIINKLYYNQSEKDREYFKSRGLTENIIKEYKLCIGKINSYDSRAILPVWQDNKVIYYNARSLESNPEIKYMKPKGKSVFFNSRYLKELEKHPIIIITEGEFDALSFEVLGYKSIAISGSNNISKLLKKIEKSKNKDKTLFLVAFDNDEPGAKATIESMLPSIKIPSKFKDVNEWLLGDKDIRENINSQIQMIKHKYKQPDSLYNYMSSSFIKEIEEYRKFNNRKTGFQNLDTKTSLYPGLYVIGGISGLGKTTFVHQLADQVANRGEHILFFSLEMGKLELLTKSISRMTVLSDDNNVNLENGISALNIRLNNIPKDKIEILKKSINKYEDNSKRFNILQGNFGTDVLGVRSYIEKYIKINKVSPLVIVDYLQIIPGSITDRTDKERIDKAVVELKRISRDFNLTVIVVSSLNRGNYMAPIAFESFKESGGIEYTSDVVWGLQLQALNDEDFKQASTATEKREVITEAMKQTPRKVELVCLKNRNGISSYSCKFLYYPKFDLFLSQEEDERECYIGGRL